MQKHYTQVNSIQIQTISAPRFVNLRHNVVFWTLDSSSVHFLQPLCISITLGVIPICFTLLHVSSESHVLKWNFRAVNLDAYSNELSELINYILLLFQVSVLCGHAVTQWMLHYLWFRFEWELCMITELSDLMSCPFRRMLLLRTSKNKMAAGKISDLAWLIVLKYSLNVTHQLTYKINTHLHVINGQNGKIYYSRNEANSTSNILCLRPEKTPQISMI
jgi:hypothetical protein